MLLGPLQLDQNTSRASGSRRSEAINTLNLGASLHNLHIVVQVLCGKKGSGKPRIDSQTYETWSIGSSQSIVFQHGSLSDEVVRRRQRLSKDFQGPFYGFTLKLQLNA